MQPLIKILFRPKYDWLISAMFFVAAYFFLWFGVEINLVYHYSEIFRKALFFETGWQFLLNYLSYPSGLSQYMAAFLTQLCYFSWLGALCITLVAWGIYRLTVSLTAFAAESPWRAFCYMPAILMLMMCCRYENPLSTGMAVLIAVFFSVMYEKFSPYHIFARAALFTIICGILYYIAGSAVLIFVALAAIYECFHHSKPVSGVLYILLGAAVYWFLGAVVFKQDSSELLLFSNPFSRVAQNLEKEKLARVFEGALFIGIPVLVLLVNLVRKLVNSRSVIRTSGWITQIALLALIVVPGILVFYRPELKKAIQVRYFNCRRQWPELLAVAKTIPPNQYQPFTINAINRALYYTGRMGDEMFAYPQNCDNRDLVLGAGDANNIALMERMELCLELGMVNVAERIAYEFLNWTNDRPNPYVLKQLALIYITKGKIETARVFLRALSKNLIYGREAKELLGRLEIDPMLQNDEHIRYLRSVMMTTDLLFGPYSGEGQCMEELLGANKHNRMAFEYLMAHYLLSNQLDKFVENIPRLDDFGYPDKIGIPRHYQEAILLYIGTTNKNVDLGSKKIDNGIINQLYEMNKAMDNSGVKDANEMQRILSPKFGRSYFYYYFFGVSGITR